MDPQPLHNPLMHRFELTLEGKLALLEYSQRDEHTLVLTHTFVPPELRGKNIAAILTAFALEYARKERKKVVPQCSYAAVYMDRNSQYADLRLAS